MRDNDTNISTNNPNLPIRTRDNTFFITVVFQVLKSDDSALSFLIKSPISYAVIIYFSKKVLNKA